MSRTPTPTNEEKKDFFKAMNDGDVSKVRDMLNSNNRLANIRDEYYSDYYPLFIVSEKGYLEIARLLIRAGADTNKVDEGWTPLATATSRGHTEIVKLLIENGANINKVDENDRTPLFYASNNDNIEIARLLVKAGANVNKADDSGWTPLFNAVRHNNLRVVEFLLDAGANVNKSSDENLTPLMVAAFHNRVQIAKLLLENGAGADINKKDDMFRKTPLMYAMKRGFDQFVKLIQGYILFNSAMDMNQDETFEVYQRVVKRGMKDAGDSDYDVEANKKLLVDVFEKVMKKRNERTRTNSRFGKSKSKSKSKKPQKRPSNTVCTRAQKLGIRLTLKRNNKRVYKSEEMLRKQIKNAVTKQNKRKQQKQKQKK